MKKLIILSGLQGTGKTHISNGFRLMFNEDECVEINYTELHAMCLNSIRQRKRKLLIVEGVPKRRIKDAYESIRFFTKDLKIVFETYEEVNPTDIESFAHVINCNNKY